MSYCSKACDVAREQLGVRLVDGRRRVGRLTSFASSVARARWSALFTEATLVSSSSATSAAFHSRTSQRMQHRALARRQVLQRRDEGEPDRLARLRDLGRIAVLGHCEPVRHRLDPGDLRERVQVLLDRLAGRPEVHRPRAALAAVRACPCRRSSRCGRARSAAPPGPRSGRGSARRARASPGRRPRRRTRSRASGSSSP